MWEEISALSDPLDRGFVEEFVRSTSPESMPEEFAELLVDESLKAPAVVWKETLRGLIEAELPVALERDHSADDAHTGDRDVFVSSDQQVLLRGIPDSRLLVYSGVGHAVHLAYPTASLTTSMPSSAATSQSPKRDILSLITELFSEPDGTSQPT
jgi:hypothetical protein